MSMDKVLNVAEIQRFCMHDGPGVRTTVFLKGCPLHCAWCHNPETQSTLPELMFYPKSCIGCRLCAAVCHDGVHRFSEGHEHEIDRSKCTLCGHCTTACPTAALKLGGSAYTIEALLAEIEKDLVFYGDAGGVTLSGGEPLLQGDAAVALLQACRARGISTAVETCGFVAAQTVAAAVPYTDLFLWDIKDTDARRHAQYTGVSNERILENLAMADAMGAATRLRCILVNGINTEEAHYAAVAEIYASLSHCEGVELIPYHAYGGTKSVFLGRADSGRADWIPQEAQTERARAVLQRFGARVI